MVAMAVSTSTASRSLEGHIDVYDNADYPIILGDSLRGQSRPQSAYVQLRHNWVPPNGFRAVQGLLRERADDIELVYREDNSSPPIYEYSGFQGSTSGDREGQDHTRLVLVFDESKSAFVLEEISTLVNLNVTAAVGLKKDNVHNQRQFQRSTNRAGVNGSQAADEEDDDHPDPSNPFDFRHFLAEAKEAGEKSSLLPGSKTPVPENSTTLGPGASPVINSGRFAHHPSLPSKPVAVAKKQSTDRPAAKTTSYKKVGPRRNDTSSTKASQPLSKERISDSDEELSDTIAVAPRAEKSHNRTISSASTADHSSNIVFSGGLEIDDGSPQQKPKRYKIDAEAFRSQTHTPVLGKRSGWEPAEISLDDDIVMRDAGHDNGEDEDDDVDELDLGSPHTRKEDSEAPEAEESRPVPEANDEDEDDALVAELMEALEEQESNSASGDGHPYRHVNDDESEVSEEE